MNATRVIGIFDVGKTNKKLFLFDEQYRVVYEKSAQLPETIDEEGDACENLQALRHFLFDSLKEVLDNGHFAVVAVNISAYGASLVYVDEQSKALTPLYNYLKPYPPDLSTKFYASYGGMLDFSMQTCSPVLGSLNSGLQLYRLKYEQPQIFKQVKYAMHLPQYLAFLFSGMSCAEITSIGCHTALWNFEQDQYHGWLSKEGMLHIMAPLADAGSITKAQFMAHDFKSGTGLHDSSAALIPYQLNFHEPFVLISTGTWCITLNPFNHHPLTTEELERDCLCYLSYKGRPVKASRLFAGQEHDMQVGRIAAYFGVSASFYKSIPFDRNIISGLLREENQEEVSHEGLESKQFAGRDISVYQTMNVAYHRLMLDIVRAQQASSNLVLQQTAVKRIYVDGGFSRNEIYMQLLAAVYPGMEVFAATIPEATALGAALVIHDAWNSKDIPPDMVSLKYFPPHRELLI